MKVIESSKLSTKEEKRYIIVDENNNVLDDAQGYGYKTIQKAHAAWSYKQKRNDKKYKTKRKKIESCLKQNDKFFNNLLERIFYDYKDDPEYEFTYAEFKECIENSDIKLDGFNTYELYKVWSRS